MADRYIILHVSIDNGERLYIVVDRKKIFNSERKASNECRRLNELEDSVIRTFDMAAEDKRRKEQSNG